MKLLIKYVIAIVILSTHTIASAFTVDGINYRENYPSDQTCCVYHYDNNLTGSITIPSKVTYEGVTYTVTRIEHLQSEGITTLTIPETVIGRPDLYCYNLKEINVSNSNTTLCSENGVLFNKAKTELILFPPGSEITNYTIPSSVLYIHTSEAFRGCNNLTTLTIPSSVTRLDGSPSMEGYMGFACENLQEINVNASNTNFSSVDGVLYDKSKKTLLVYPRGKRSTTFNMPNSVTHIYERAFSYNSYINNVILSENLLNIGNEVFSGCVNLSSISIPNTIEEIGQFAFSNCNELTSINFPENLKVINTYVFYGCELESLYYNAINLNSGIINQTFQNCKIKELHIGENVRRFPGFSGDFDIEDGIYITNLSSWLGIDFTESYNPLESCKKLYLNGTLLEQISIPSDVTYIGDYAFYNLSDCENISIPSSVTHIGKGAFYNVPFETLTINENVTYIGQDAFNQVKHLNFNAINCGECCSFSTLESLDFGNKVETIPSYFLSGNRYLTSVTIPESVKNIGDRVFSSTKITKLIIPNNVTSIGNYLIDFSSITDLEIYGAITSISPYTFYSAINLKSIILPESLIEIGDFAFFNCSELGNVNLPKSLTTIGKSAFYSCRGLTDIVFPDNVNYLPFQCLMGCALSSITLPKNLEYIGSDALFGNNFTSVVSLNPVPPTFINDTPSTYTGPSFGDFISANYSNAILYVPKGSLQAYKAADVWKNFQNIAEYQPTEINLVDGEDFFNDESIENVTVTYTRDYSSTGWHALYLPFDMAYDEWADYGIVAKLNNVHQYDTDNDGVLDKTFIEYNRVTSGNIRANTPYVFKPYAAGEITFTCEDRTVFAAPTEDAHVDCSTTEMLYTIYGNFQTKSVLRDMGAYALSADGAFVQAKTASQTLKPYRIYLIISPRTDSGYVDTPMLRMPERVEIMVDGETTSIEDLIITTQEKDVYYDLMGRPVYNPSSGLYILNGKKVYIK